MQSDWNLDEGRRPVDDVSMTHTPDSPKDISIKNLLGTGSDGSM